MSAKERINLYDSELKVPNFVSENPSVKSQFSDQVESHPLTEIDDYDVDENLSNIVLSIKKQNDDLVNKIKSKRPESWGVISSTHWVRGLPLQGFRSPEVVKTKTISPDQVSPDHVLLTVIKSRNIESSKADSEADFERDEDSFLLSKTGKENNLETEDSHDWVVLQNWVRLLSTRLKAAKKEIEMLKASKQQELIDYEKRMREYEKSISKLKTKNKLLNRKLLQAVETMKMSWFSFELNFEHDQSENIIDQLLRENNNLRKLLKIQNEYDCREDVEEILRSEELIVRNKEAYLRSRSLQFKNNRNFSFIKNVESPDYRKGKKSQGGQLSLTYRCKRIDQRLY